MNDNGLNELLKTINENIREIEQHILNVEKAYIAFINKSKIIQRHLDWISVILSGVILLFVPNYDKFLVGREEEVLFYKWYYLSFLILSALIMVMAVRVRMRLKNIDNKGKEYIDDLKSMVNYYKSVQADTEKLKEFSSNYERYKITNPLDNEKQFVRSIRYIDILTYLNLASIVAYFVLFIVQNY